MDPVVEAARVLERAGVSFSKEGASLRVPPDGPEGFEVWIGPGRTWQVAYEGWHEEFTDPEQALACFLLGLTDGVRLLVTRWGGKACAWAVESREPEGWKALGSVGLLFFPFWRRKQIVTRGNRRLTSPPR